MTRQKKETQAKVAVELLCIYSGETTSMSVGEIIEVDAKEADRLISLGAAKAADDK